MPGVAAEAAAREPAARCLAYAGAVLVDMLPQPAGQPLPLSYQGGAERVVAVVRQITESLAESSAASQNMARFTGRTQGSIFTACAR